MKLHRVLFIAATIGLCAMAASAGSLFDDLTDLLGLQTTVESDGSSGSAELPSIIATDVVIINGTTQPLIFELSSDDSSWTQCSLAAGYNGSWTNANYIRMGTTLVNGTVIQAHYRLEGKRRYQLFGVFGRICG